MAGPWRWLAPCISDQNRAFALAWSERQAGRDFRAVFLTVRAQHQEWVVGSGPVFNQTVPVKFGFLTGIAKGQVQRNYTVNLDLVEGPSPEAADLAVRLDARPFAERLGLMTYAVSLVNNGTLAATDVRAEFTLPAGWRLLGTAGWSGCSSSGRSVVCRVDSLAVAEQRALLVDVQAPDAGGSHTAHARVLAAEGDANLVDNTAQLVTQILE